MTIYIRTRDEFAVNSFTAANQTAPSVATFADGGFVVVWGSLDPAQDGHDSAIKAQLFDAAGRKVGAEFLVNSAASGAQFTASVATLADGRFIVTWVTNGSEDWTNGIKAQMFGRDGDPVGGEFQVNTSTWGSHFYPNVEALAGGGFVISWDDWYGFDAKAQIFDASGARVGGEFRLNTSAGATEDSTDVTALANGGFVATWRSTATSADGSGDAVKAQLFDASGARVGTEFLVNSQTIDSQYDPSITALAGGGFVITWATRHTAQDGSGGAVKGQIFSASGAKVGAEFLVNTQAADIQREAVVTATPDGGFVVAWTNYSSSQDGSGFAVKAQAFDPAGAKVGGEMLVNTLTTGSQFLPAIDTLADGRLIVAWTSATGDIDGYAVRAQILGTEPAPPLPNTAPWIISNGAGASAALTRDEGVTAVTNVVASDDGEPNVLRYSISGGADAGLFSINALTGALAFIQPPDHEAPLDQDGDNIYDVTVTASDGELTGSQSLQISVLHVNQVAIVSDGGGDFAMLSIDENQTGVTTVSAVDSDGAQLSYAITGGEDAGFFTIDAETGALSFVVAPDYEWPEDWYGDNVYFVQVTASDGNVADTQDIAVEVLDMDEGGGGVVITSDGGGDEAAVTMAENETAVTVVAASGGGAPTYEIVGGADDWQFTIDASSGALSFVFPPDFDWANDADLDNVYEVIVRAGDGETFDDQHLFVSLTNVDEAPEIVSYGRAASVPLTMAENGWRVGQVEAWDPDDYYAPVAYAIYGGADASLFTVDSSTGELAFRFDQRPDFEAPADADGDNVYEVTVAAISGTLHSTQAFSVTIVDENEGIFIVSNGGGTSASLSMLEGESHVTTVVAHDPDGTIPVYSIVGGPDAAAFTIDPQTGVLSFVETPDHEAPADSAGANFYTVQVAASDGEYSTWQSVQIFVGNVDEPVTVTSHGGEDEVALSVGENSLAVTEVNAADADGGPVSYAISGGADAAFFTIDASTGALSFVTGPDHEAPTDADGDNVYAVTVSATDGAFTDSQAFTVTVSGVDEAVAIDSNGGGASAAVTRSENGVDVTIVTAADPDGGAVTYAIAGGADAARFTIDASTGALAFISAPDFEAPADAGADNVFDVIVSASDGGSTDTQAIAVTIGNVNEPVAIHSNGGGASAAVAVAENVTTVTTVAAADADGSAVTYSITGGEDAARFTIDASTGALAFVSAPNFEAPADAGANNVYDVIVSASDGAFTDSQAIAVTVGNVNEPVVISSNGGGATAGVTVAENALAVTTVAATDADGGAVTYAIAGGADAVRFTIDASSGALTFVSPPNFEAPADAGSNNVYDVVVSASDGALTDTQAIAVTVLNVNEPVVIGSNGGGSSAAVAVAENATAVTTVAAADADGGAVAYAIAGGADAARFTINAATGALAFVSPPDFEAPADAGSNNVYDVIVSASDGTYSDQQALAVTVTNVLEGNVITGTGSADTIASTKTVAGQPFATAYEDTIYGLGGADTLMGGGGADIIDGGSGNDLIYGDAGADRLTGGIGADRFALRSTADSPVGAPDLVTDFNRSQADRIGLSDIDARTNAGGNNAFTFIGTSAFSGVSGQLRYEQSGGSTFVSGDVNGDRIADFQIQLQGTIALTSADFIL